MAVEESKLDRKRAENDNIQSVISINDGWWKWHFRELSYIFLCLRSPAEAQIEYILLAPNCSSDAEAMFEETSTLSAATERATSFSEIEQKWRRGEQLTDLEEKEILSAIKTNSTFLRVIETSLLSTLTSKNRERKIPSGIN